MIGNDGGDDGGKLTHELVVNIGMILLASAFFQFGVWLPYGMGASSFMLFTNWITME